MTQKALKLALEALKRATNYDPVIARAITTIKEALAQPDPYKQGYTDAMNWKVQNHLEHLPTAKPEQEPVAHFGSAYVNENGVHITTVLGPVAIPQDAKLYTTPPQRTWVGLTDEEMTHANHHMVEGAYQYSFKQGAKWAEAKLKQKNGFAEENT